MDRAPPVAGGTLLLLAFLWLAARLLIALPTPWLLGAAVETGFWLMLTGLFTHEVVVARNTRNLPVSVALGLLGGASAVDWLETAGVLPDQNIGPRLALTVLVGLIALIGGRIVPNFTRTWLKQHQISDVPPPPDRLDHIALGLTIASMAGWTAFPQSPMVALLLALAGLATVAQLARWRGAATGAEGLVWILHVAYAGVPVGLLVLAAAVWRPAWGLDGAALHALGAGAITLMVVAIMTRATLGHSGLALRADAPTRWIYGFLLIAALARGGAAVPGTPYWPLLLISGGAWIAGFLVYLGRYGVIQARGAGPQPR
ncbi:NnrS protein [Pararhodospirillum photometricum DSM 122]|uniref:NnrS protein n=1 Tax=Pararhodospirillum photometricum DSM 122 TaxID=1150469 RepID=H6SRD0_PARPM|nr:NnrS family protein [Pararhodospirillum photometricum]CCG07459.1 NnrS protein [Pararhodospirillum photometricum DSM 122]